MVHSVRLHRVGQERAHELHSELRMTRKSICTALTPRMRAELTLATSHVIAVDFLYISRGTSRDVLISTGVVYPLGTPVALKICKAFMPDNSEELTRLLLMKSKHLPEVFGFVPCMEISDWRTREKLSILVLEAIPISIRDQLAAIRYVQPCALPALFIEDILREGLNWLVGSWMDNGDQFSPLQTEKLGLRMSYVQYCCLHEAGVKSQGVAPMILMASELCIVCLDATRACKNRERGRSDFNKSLKFFMRDVSSVIGDLFNHPVWRRYSKQVLCLLEAIMTEFCNSPETSMMQVCHRHMERFRQMWLEELTLQQASGQAPAFKRCAFACSGASFRACATELFRGVNGARRAGDV